MARVMPNKVTNRKGKKKASQGDLLHLHLQGDEAGTSRHRHESSKDMSITKLMGTLIYLNGSLTYKWDPSFINGSLIYKWEGHL